MAIGGFGALKILLMRAFRINTARCVRIKGEKKDLKVLMRPLESDLFVASQVFGWREYDVGAQRRKALNHVAARWRLDDLKAVIIDAGANVGYSSIFFANTYPDAVILAVEPNPSTFEILKRNVIGNDRIIPINAALWSHDAGVDMAAGDSGSWSDRVSDGPSLTSTSRTPSIRLDQLMDKVHCARSLIIKLDIEGSEREVCRVSRDILGKSPCIIIEPHDFMLPGAGSLVPLFSAISGKEVDTLLMGENLTIMEIGILQQNGMAQGRSKAYMRPLGEIATHDA